MHSNLGEGQTYYQRACRLNFARSEPHRSAITKTRRPSRLVNPGDKNPEKLAETWGQTDRSCGNSGTGWAFSNTLEMCKVRVAKWPSLTRGETFRLSPGFLGHIGANCEQAGLTRRGAGVKL